MEVCCSYESCHRTVPYPTHRCGASQRYVLVRIYSSSIYLSTYQIYLVNLCDHSKDRKLWMKQLQANQNKRPNLVPLCVTLAQILGGHIDDKYARICNLTRTQWRKKKEKKKEFFSSPSQPPPPTKDMHEKKCLLIGNKKIIDSYFAQVIQVILASWNAMVLK